MKRGVTCRRGHDEWSEVLDELGELEQYVCTPCRRDTWRAGAAAYRGRRSAEELDAHRRRDRARKKRKRIAAEAAGGVR